MKYKVGDFVVGVDKQHGYKETGVIVKVNDDPNKGQALGYYINRVTSNATFFFEYEVRLATKLEKTLK